MKYEIINKHMQDLCTEVYKTVPEKLKRPKQMGCTIFTIQQIVFIGLNSSKFSVE